MCKDEWTWKEWVEWAENLNNRLIALEKPKLDLSTVIKSQAAAAQIENAANARTDVRTLIELTAFAKRLIEGDLRTQVTYDVKVAARKVLGLE